MKRPRRERQHAWREHSAQRKWRRRFYIVAQSVPPIELKSDAIGHKQRLERALMADDRLKRLGRRL